MFFFLLSNVLGHTYAHTVWGHPRKLIVTACIHSSITAASACTLTQTDKHKKTHNITNMIATCKITHKTMTSWSFLSFLSRSSPWVRQIVSYS